MDCTWFTLKNCEVGSQNDCIVESGGVELHTFIHSSGRVDKWLIWPANTNRQEDGDWCSKISAVLYRNVKMFESNVE